MRQSVHAALLACLLIFGGIGVVPDARAQNTRAADEPPIWAPLGPSGVFQAGQIAVSSGWPADPFLLVTLHGMDSQYELPSDPPPAARTYDGGRTWEPLYDIPGGQVTVLWTERYGRVLLQRKGGPPNERTAGVLTRSTDDGLTWDTVRATTPRADYSPRAAEIVIASPDVYHDAHVVVLEDGAAFQSFDAGATWESLEPVPGQQFGTVVFSPDVANDGTLYLTANSGPFSSIGGTRDERAEHHHSDSAGILVSRDHGRTWESTSAGLQIEGDPYRQVASLTISPTFARDGTLLAYAWGPWLGDDPKEPRGPHTALFRSQDRGQTWESIWEPFSRTAARRSAGRYRAYVTPALSPAYADNGLILATQNGSSGSPASGHCNLLRSEDFGQTWTSRGIVSSYGGCWGLRFGGSGPTMAFWHYSSSGVGGWSSTNRQFRIPFWQGFGPRLRRSIPGQFSGPTVGPDGTVFTYGTGGVWVLGPQDRATYGRLPCPTTESEVYGAARLAAPYAQPWLGCPTGEPYTVTVRARSLGDLRALWIEDDDPHALLLTVDQNRAYGEAQFVNKAAHAWSGPPDHVFQTEVQRFEGGVILRLPAAGSQSATMLVAAGFGWQEVTAP